MLTKFQNTVLKWYDNNGRILPWRQTTNPYHILVSEIMLQQTQVDRLIKYSIMHRKAVNCGKIVPNSHIITNCNSNCIRTKKEP